MGHAPHPIPPLPHLTPHVPVPLQTNQARFEQLRSHYENEVATKEMEVSTTSHKLSALQAELDAKENDAQTQRQQKEQAGKYEERLRALNTEIRTLRKRQNEYTQPSLSLLGPARKPHTSHPTSPATGTPSCRSSTPTAPKRSRSSKGKSPR